MIAAQEPALSQLIQARGIGPAAGDALKR